MILTLSFNLLKWIHRNLKAKKYPRNNRKQILRIKMRRKCIEGFLLQISEEKERVEELNLLQFLIK
jgi:hypothetical protein